MTPPSTTSKHRPVVDRRVGGAVGGAAPLRRYRLARLRLDARMVESASRSDQLKRS